MTFNFYGAPCECGTDNTDWICIQKYFFTFWNANTFPKSKIEDDNPRQFWLCKYRSVNVKNAMFDWTRMAMPTSLCEAKNCKITLKVICDQDLIWKMISDPILWREVYYFLQKGWPRKSSLHPVKSPFIF